MQARRSARATAHISAASHRAQRSRPRLQPAASAADGAASSSGGGEPVIDVTYDRPVGVPEEGMNPEVAEALKRVQAAMADAETNLQVGGGWAGGRQGSPDFQFQQSVPQRPSARPVWTCVHLSLQGSAAHLHALFSVVAGSRKGPPTASRCPPNPLLRSALSSCRLHACPPVGPSCCDLPPSLLPCLPSARRFTRLDEQSAWPAALRWGWRRLAGGCGATRSMSPALCR